MSQVAVKLIEELINENAVQQTNAGCRQAQAISAPGERIVPPGSKGTERLADEDRIVITSTFNIHRGATKHVITSLLDIFHC